VDANPERLLDKMQGALERLCSEHGNSGYLKGEEDWD
jgi:hypothetical protein